MLKKMYLNNKTLLLLLLFLLSLIIIIITLIKELFNDNNDSDFIIKTSNNNNFCVLYDGKLLRYPARKKIKNKHDMTTIAVDCNSNLIECRVDNNCTAKCLPLNYHTTKCLNGLCQYMAESKEKSLCQNGGQITSTFEYGRLLTACICPENFIGLYCQTPNEMMSSYLRTFKITF